MFVIKRCDVDREEVYNDVEWTGLKLPNWYECVLNY